MNQETIQNAPDTFNDGSELVQENKTQDTHQSDSTAVSDNSSQVQVELSEVEKQAYEMGWRPKEEYAGSSFVPAQEYVNRAPLFDRIEKQSREIRELKDLVKNTTSHLTSIRQESYERAFQELETKKLRAIESGDVTDFRAVEAQTRSLQQKMSNDNSLKQTTSPSELDPEVMSFSERNKTWYNHATPENQKMVAAAQAIDNYLAQQASIDGRSLNPKEHLRAVEARIRQEFPHRFENLKRQAPSTVGKSSATISGNKMSGLAAKLSPQQIELGKKFNKSNPEYTLEKYAADLEAMGRLPK